jgi:hypothetical protein
VGIRTGFSLALASAALLLSSQASAASFVSGTGAGTSVTIDATDPFGWTLNYNGFSDGGAPVNGLLSSIGFTFVGTSFASGNTTFNFQYAVSNDSVNPITNSRVSTFGFNTNPNLVSNGASSTGIFNNQAYGSNVPNIGTIEVCFLGGNGNCAGGGNAGVSLGDASALGTFSLTFAGTPATINLSDFYVRYQSIEGAGNVTSAVGQPGTPVSAVPEPSTWLLMIAGFGLVGFSMRRRRQTRIAFA